MFMQTFYSEAMNNAEFLRMERERQERVKVERQARIAQDADKAGYHSTDIAAAIMHRMLNYQDGE